MYLIATHRPQELKQVVKVAIGFSRTYRLSKHPDFQLTWEDDLAVLFPLPDTREQFPDSEPMLS